LHPAEPGVRRPPQKRLLDRARGLATGVARRDPKELLSIAAEALVRYKLRTSLSVLGVVLGVAAVIAMMSVSEGAQAEALQQVERMGLDNLIARNRGLTSEQSTRFSPVGLTAAESQRLLDLVPLLNSASPVVERYVSLSLSGKTMTSRVLGIGASYQTIRRLRLARGRFLTPIDDRELVRVCVLGGPLARLLFGYGDAVGQSIRIEAEYYKVVGVLAEPRTDADALTGEPQDFDRAVLVPLSALIGQRPDVARSPRVDEIWLQASNSERVEEIGRVLQHTVTRLHGGVPDVEIVVPRELLAQRYRTQRTFSVVVGSIATLALIIGGIGIMNIMLTSVTERTGEIGIRRAFGATRRDVTAQFLAESLLMTLGGGTVGILVGVIVSAGITAYAGWATRVSLAAVFLAFGVSFLVGVVFGMYPAVKASRLQPVDALRYE
jgi:putative ABC transport system permease protein